MQELIQTLATGLSQGALYGLLAVAIVLPWRVSNVAPFCQGTLGMCAAFLAYFTVGSTFGAGVATLVAVLFGIGFTSAAYLGVVAFSSPSVRTTEAGHINLVMRTFGLDIVLLAIAGSLWAEKEPYRFPSLVPAGSFGAGDVKVSTAALCVLVFVLVAVTVLHLLFARTRVGLRLQAVAENPTNAELIGVSPAMTAFIARAVAGGLAALAAVLYTPFTYLTTGMMVAFLLKAFAAILLGGRDSWFGVLLGGLLLGVLESFVGNYLSYLWQPALAFVVITLVLVLRPQGLFAHAAASRV